MLGLLILLVLGVAFTLFMGPASQMTEPPRSTPMANSTPEPSEVPSNKLANTVTTNTTTNTRPTPQASKTTITISESPTPQASDRWEAMRNTIETELKTGGRLAFDPPESMVQGSTATVTARIATQDVGPALTSGFRNPEKPADEIRVAQVMKVILLSDDGAFTIMNKSSEEQVLVSPYTQWEWNVKAEQSGQHKLHLKVVATIRTADRGEKALDIPVADKEITVDVSYKYIIGSFVRNSENWKYLIGSTSLLTVLGVALGWFRNRFKKPKPTPPSDDLAGGGD